MEFPSGNRKFDEAITILEVLNFFQESRSDTTCWISGLNNLKGGQLSLKFFPINKF